MNIEILRVIWWVLLGVIMMGFAVTDGFDFGAAILFPFIARTEVEKRIVLNAIGPFWEGNQVWIILGAGAILAAWPFVYAVAFSGFYFLILLLLLTMGISRPVSFKYRSKLTNSIWRSVWDVSVFIGGICPAFILGVLVGNILNGIPFYFDHTLRMFYTGSFISLFHPFPALCGLLSIAMLVMHGGLYLGIKTENPLQGRALSWSQTMALIIIILFAGAGFCIAHQPGYVIVSGGDPLGYSNPLHKQVIMQAGAWLHNYHAYPLTILAPVAGFIGAFLVLLLAKIFNRVAFICSGFSLMGIIATVGVSMFPFILPSSENSSASLLVWDASSAELTLFLMLVATIIFLPLILIYTSWVYYALRGKVVADQIEKNKQAY